MDTKANISQSFSWILNLAFSNMFVQFEEVGMSFRNQEIDFLKLFVQPFPNSAQIAESLKTKLSATTLPNITLNQVPLESYSLLFGTEC